MKPKYNPADILYDSNEDRFFMIMHIDKDAYMFLNLESGLTYPYYIDYVDSRIHISLVAQMRVLIVFLVLFLISCSGVSNNRKRDMTPQCRSSQQKNTYWDECNR